MRLTASTVIFALFIVGIYGASFDFPLTPTSPDLPPVVTTEKPKSTTTTTTTEASSTTTTVTPSTTASTSTTTTTPEPSTSTTTAAPTTTAPTTTAPTTTAPTTTAPTTTVAPVTTPAPAPVPLPAPNTGSYSYNDKNVTCISLEFAVQFNVSYFDNAANHSVYKQYNMPNDTSKVTSGSCGDEQFIEIGWNEQNATNTLLLSFALNGSDFYLKEIVAELSSNILPNEKSSSTKLYHVTSVFKIPKDRSYHCTKVTSWNLTNNEVNGTEVGSIDFSHVLMQAYHTGSSKGFSQSVDCDAMNTPDIVPIAVGIALIALVVIVLIAYIVGRRRAQSRGYVSM